MPSTGSGHVPRMHCAYIHLTPQHYIPGSTTPMPRNSMLQGHSTAPCQAVHASAPLGSANRPMRHSSAPAPAPGSMLLCWCSAIHMHTCISSHDCPVAEEYTPPRAHSTNGMRNGPAIASPGMPRNQAAVRTSHCCCSAGQIKRCMRPHCHHRPRTQQQPGCHVQCSPALCLSPGST